MPLVEEAHRRDEPDAASRPSAPARAASRSSATVRSVLMPATSCSGQRPVWRTSSSNRASSSGATRSTAARWASTVASSPRATGPVSAASGPSSATFSTVWRTSGSSSGARLVAVEAGARGDRLRRRLERHEEVRGHGRGRVVGGAALVVDLERRHAEPLGELGRRTRAPRAWCPPPRPRRPRSARPDGRTTGADAARSPARPAWASAVSGVAPLVWPTSGAAAVTASAAAAISASGTQSTMASQRAGRSPRPGRAVDVDAGVAERPRKGGADPACADYAHAQRARE